MPSTNNIIKHKRSSTPGAIPSVGSIEQSELAINLADGKLYTKNSNDEIINLGVTTISGAHIFPASGTLNTVIFNNVGDPDLGTGQLGWNASEGTLALGLSDNYEMFLGGELHYRVRNNTGSTILAGTPVYATGLTPGGNNRIEIAPNVADGSIREVRFMGLMTENCDSGVNGFTTHFGYIRGVDTRGDASANGTTNKLWASGEPSWSEGDILYVHPTVAGKLTKIEPKHSISVAIVLNKASNGKLFVRPTSYGHLDDNHDVNTSGVTNNQYLRYDSSSDMWVPTSSGIFNNVAIGSDSIPSTPIASLYVKGNIHTSGNGFFGTFDNNEYVQVGTLNGDVGLFDYEDSAIAVKQSDGLYNYYSITIDSANNDNVGISNTAPAAKLDVNGDILSEEINIVSAVSGATLFNIEGTNGNLFSVVDNMSGSLMSVNDITGLPAFEVFSDHSIVAGRFNANDFVISSGGNVGIGTSTPSEKLEINGALKFTNAPKILRSDFLNLDIIASGGGHAGWRLTNQGNNGRTFRVSSYADNTSASFRIRDDNVGLDRFVINENGYIGIGTSTPVGRLDIRASGTNSTALTIQNSNGYNIFQYLKTDDTNLLRASFDGSNFHHYLGARLYYNIGTNGVTFDGGGGSNQSQVSVTNRAYIGLNSSSTSAPGSANIHAGSTAYATSDNTLTSITPFAFTTWAWNGSNGYSINSHGYMKQVQNSTTAGDARLSIARGSDNSELFTVNYLDGNVGIGTSLPTELLTVYGDSQYLYLQAQNNSGAAGIKFGNTAARQQMYIEGTSSDLVIDSMNGGVTESIRVGYNTGAVTINEQGSNIDFRVEGDTDQNLLFVDASSDRVGIGTTAPTSKLMILTPDNYAGQVLKLQTKAENTYSLYAEANSPAGGVVTWSWNQLNAGITYANVLVFDRGNVGIGTESPTYKLQVNGSFGATTKSFRIDHPSRPNYTLEYGSLESPYHGVRLTGRGRVVKGSGVVSLPYYLKDLIHDDETINIQITNIKHGKNIYVDEIDLNNDQFTVRVDRAKTLGTLEFFWTFTGTRKDVDKLVVEAEK